MSREAARAKLKKVPVETNGVSQFTQGDAPVRYIVEAGDPLFVAKDVCDILGLKCQHSAMRRLDADEFTKRRMPTPGGHQLMNFVTIAGVDHLTQTSDKPEAKAMWRKIRHEVLPDIRKKGFYVASPEAFALEMFQDPVNLARTVVSVSTKLVEIEGQFTQVLDTSRELTRICKQQDSTIKQLQKRLTRHAEAYIQIRDESVHLVARAEMAKHLLHTGLLINVTTIAGDLHFRRASELNRVLNKAGVIKYNRGGKHWQLRARYAEIEDLTVLAPFIYQQEEIDVMGNIAMPAKAHYHMYWTPLGSEVVRRVVEAKQAQKAIPCVRQVAEALRDA